MVFCFMLVWHQPLWLWPAVKYKTGWDGIKSSDYTEMWTTNGTLHKQSFTGSYLNAVSEH